MTNLIGIRKWIKVQGLVGSQTVNTDILIVYGGVIFIFLDSSFIVENSFIITGKKLR